MSTDDRSLGTPIMRGLRSRCPRCGEGRLFQGFLTLRPSCERCGLDYSFADSADGPAVFVIMIVGFLVVFGALFAEVAYHPPVWVHLVTWLPLGAILCLGLLRPMKGLMIAAQIRNKAAEHRRDEGA